MTARSASVRPLSLEGCRAWIISDGKAGHEIQCLGVAAALGVEAEIKRVAPRGLYKLTAPWGPVAPTERFGHSGSRFGPPWPAIAFATGRVTTPYIRALKRMARLQTYTVILLDSRTGASSADLFWVPEHDSRRGPNVITTLTSPHGFTPSRLAALRADMPPEIAALPAPRVAVLIGGPNGDYSYGAGDISRLAASLAGLAQNGASLMMTPSRRTPPGLIAALDAATAAMPRLLWSGAGDNPYPSFLAHADAFVVTADSVNMAGEAAATGKPIYIFTASGSSPKFARYHAALQAYGATRPLPDGARAALEQWTYAPLDSAHTIAAEITRRWARRAAMLPGLVRGEDGVS